MSETASARSRIPARLCSAILATLLTALTSQAAVPTDKVRLYFNMGPVEIELYGNESPLNVANFLTYVDDGDYDNSFIHRTRSYDPNQLPYYYDLFAQGGSFKVPDDYVINSNPIAQRDPVPNEFDASNGLTNSPGSLAAARTSDPDSATSGWFINQSDNSIPFDAGPYTVFGQVTSGMDIIDAIPFLPNAQELQGTSFDSTPFYYGSLVTIYRAVRIPIVAGDYDFSGTVDAADCNVWKAAFGTSTNLAADGNGDGIIDAADYTVWRDSPSAGGGASLLTTIVPEPAAAALLLAGLATLSLALRRRRA